MGEGHDLLAALDAYISELENDPGLKRSCDHVLDDILSVKSYLFLPGKPEFRQRIKKQIRLCWDSRIGEINTRGDVVTLFKKPRGAPNSSA